MVIETAARLGIGLKVPQAESPTGEDLKRSLVAVDPTRSRDALHGVEESPYSRFAAEATVGPYNGELKEKPVRDFLSDPEQVIVIGCGRNEAARGNLGPNLSYMHQATNGAGNVLYIDANSTDRSVIIAREKGVHTLRRGDVFPDVVDKQRLAEILSLPPEVLDGKDIPGQTPLRKGIDIHIARIALMQASLRGKAPEYMLYSDTDLKSIPGGPAEERLKQIDPEQVYKPLELVAQGTIELNSRRRTRQHPDNQWAVFTGSENRNNETIFGIANMLAADATSPFLDEGQSKIADALRVLPGIIVHPLTGELIVSTKMELDAMGATGQCVEIARILSLAGKQHEVLGTTDPDRLKDMLSLIGNVRRGKQQRIDEPQMDEKEWWMIGGVIPQFFKVVTDYSIQARKFPHQFILEDYVRINRWLARINNSSRLNNKTQTREVDHYPMERAVPPVSLLHKEGVLKI